MILCIWTHIYNDLVGSVYFVARDLRANVNKDRLRNYQ